MIAIAMRAGFTRPVAALIAALALFAAACGAAAGRCPECDRHECLNMTFSIHMKDGRTVRTCCPRCGLRFIRADRAGVDSLTVKDFATAASLDATAAFYVEGSDVSPCTMTRPNSPKDERGCCLSPVYDRCLPSLVGFASKTRAEAFAREHGGTVKLFVELDRPTL